MFFQKFDSIAVVNSLVGLQRIGNSTAIFGDNQWEAVPVKAFLAQCVVRQDQSPYGLLSEADWYWGHFPQFWAYRRIEP